VSLADFQRRHPRTLLLDTSARRGVVGVAVGDTVRESVLDESRRHARDLAATCRKLMDESGFTASQLSAVVVGTGPGSYTGLRVGLMTAKTLAYALGCPCYAVPTFDVLAVSEGEVAVVSDALQGLVYCQAFRAGVAVGPLQITPIDAIPAVPLIGPTAIAGLEVRTVSVSAAAMARVACGLEPLGRAELFALEPLYLRGSSAEEKLKATKPA
jgi:tRNA threonylcarbamoyladenosine biosynthesis protein TsaB